MVRRGPAGLFSALCLAALSAFGVGCEAEVEARTQLMLVADTDIAEVQTIAFEVTGPKNDMRPPRSGEAHGAEPVTLALVHTKGPLGPLRVTARGLNRNDEEVLSRTHEVSFVPGKTLTVRMHLAARCLQPVAPCSDGDVCSERGCVPTKLTASDLEPYTPDLPRIDGANDGGSANDGGPSDQDSGAGQDAGPRDASASDAAALTPCPDAGMVDLMRDPAHCGGCGMACVQPDEGRRGETVCEQGMCQLVCPELTDDCDGVFENGCEQDLTVRNHCGACGQVCMPPKRCNMMGQCPP